MMSSAPVRALIMCALVGAHAAEAQEVSTRTQQEVQNRVVGMLHAIDKLEWSSVAAAFTPRVRIDYTSLFGGDAEVLATDSLVARWKGLLPGFDATQHLIGPVIVTRHRGKTASAETQVRGYHRIGDAEGGAIWMVAGRYELEMEERNGSWLIAGITLRVAYQEGNRELPRIALSRGQGERRQSP